MTEPIVLVSSHPPRPDHLADFCLDAREFIRRHNPQHEVLVISHTDARGEGVFPIIDLSDREWHMRVAGKINELNPHVVHLQYDEGMYGNVDGHGTEANPEGFLGLLSEIECFPTVVEPHAIRARMRDADAEFVHLMCELADVVLFKCHYHKWRLDWSFPGMGWKTPTNVLIVPHGSRPDRRYGVHEVPQLRRDLGLDKVPTLGEHLVGLIGWTQANSRWSILTDIWEEIEREIRSRTGQHWDLLATGVLPDPWQPTEPAGGEAELRQLERKGLAHFYEFIPTGNNIYRMLGACDFIVLPGTDDAQSAMLARIIALNKPFIAAAPIEGMAARTLESGGGLLFTNRRMLKDAVLRLACDEGLRLQLGNQLKSYLEDVVSWDLIAEQYNEAYELARTAKLCGVPVDLTFEY
ncbi:MAG TPA: hypothetical protein VLM89_15120 [Phycisphaerae bacterium]|nr:hypothetical protein [Phycisphaerae bacterium]